MADYSGLQHLLKASSKAQVSDICQQIFAHRNAVSHNVVVSVSEALSITEQEANQLCAALSHLIKLAVFEGCMDSASVGALLPSELPFLDPSMSSGDFHSNLKKLLVDIIAKHMSEWKATVTEQQVSLPRLQEFDWRVDVKSSSDAVSRMAVPTCLLQMKVRETATDASRMPPVQTVTVELSKETLDTMLNGLGVIRDQLSSVSKS